MDNRYSLFFVLYPVGISSEWWLMYHAANATSSLVVAGIFYFFLVLYVPGMFHSWYLLVVGLSNGLIV